MFRLLLELLVFMDMTQWRLLVKFLMLGSKTDFLRKILDDFAWFCVEELKKQIIPSKIVIFDKKGPGPEKSRTIRETNSLIGPL